MYTGTSLKSRLLGSSLGSILVRVSGKLLALVLAIVLARHLGSDGYGVYSYVLAIVTLIAIPAQFGVPQLVVRETAKAVVNREWGVLRALWIWANSFVAILSILLCCIAALFLWSISASLSQAEVAVFGMALLLVPLISFGNLRGSALIGLSRVVTGQLPEYIIRPATFIALISVYAAVSGTIVTPFDAITVHAVAATIAFLVGVLLLQRSWPIQLRREKSLPDFRATQWRASVIPLGIISGLQIVTTQIDIVILGLFASDEVVGVYRVVAQTSILVAFGLDAINTVVAPQIARLFEQKLFPELQSVATICARYSMLIGTLIFGIFLLFGKFLLEKLFGADFATGHTILLVLCVGQLINAAAGSVGYILKMSGHELEVARAAGGSALLNIALNFALIPHYGGIGAAISTAVSISVLNIYLALVVRRRIGINSTIFSAQSQSNQS